MVPIIIVIILIILIVITCHMVHTEGRHENQDENRDENQDREVNTSVNIFVFHRDLRLEDNTTLNAAARAGKILPVFVYDDQQLNSDYASPRAISFMMDCVGDLAQRIAKCGGYLTILNSQEELTELAESMGADIYCNYDYTPFARHRDAGCIQHHDNVLAPTIFDVKKPYLKFTPFYKSVKNIKIPKPYTEKIQFVSPREVILRKVPEYRGKRFEPLPTREGALNILRLYNFDNYETARDRLDMKTTELSAHIKFGTISIREVYHATSNKSFHRQLFWRDFYYAIAASRGDDAFEPYYEKYKDIWSSSPPANANTLFAAWCGGRTGYPIVDAAMRELNETGFMHNRARMIVADFLVKLLRIDWRLGEKYFATHLLDYDPIINNYNWQWIAGTAPWSQPYFRVFNSASAGSQQERYDPEGIYVNTWVPSHLEQIVNYEDARAEYLVWIKNQLKTRRMAVGSAPAPVFLVLSNQLFHDIRPLQGHHVILHEVQKSSCNVAMKYYEKYLRANNIEVSYADENFDWDIVNIAYDPIDKQIIEHLVRSDCDILPNPGFLLSDAELANYYNENSDLHDDFEIFFQYMMDILNIPEDIPSLDNYEVDNSICPMTHRQARDLMYKSDYSSLSGFLNCGLLTSWEVLDYILASPLGTWGFIRQLCWREYQRYLYQFKSTLLYRVVE